MSRAIRWRRGHGLAARQQAPVPHPHDAMLESLARLHAHVRAMTPEQRAEAERLAAEWAYLLEDAP